MLSIIKKYQELILVFSIQFIACQALFAQGAEVTSNGSTVTEYLERAERALAVDRLTTPRDYNAVAYIERALAIAPDNPRAIQLLERVTKRYGEMVSNSLKQGERLRRINLQRAKVFRDRAYEVIIRHGLGTTELQDMDKHLARYRLVPDNETSETIPAQSVSSTLVRKLFDQHILLGELALDLNNVEEAEWHVKQASELAHRYALTSVRLRPLKQEIMSSSKGSKLEKLTKETHLLRENDAGKGTIEDLIASHVQLGKSAFGRGNITMARHHRDIAVVLASQHGITDKSLNRFAEQFADKGTRPSLPWGFRIWGTF